MRYHTVLFDLDGTLTDSYEGITRSAAYALNCMGIKIEDRQELRCFIGPPLKDSFMEYYHMKEEDADFAVSKYRERFRDTGIYENQLYAGVEEMLKALRDAGMTLCVSSSKPRIFVERILDYFHLSSYFSLVVGSELDGRLGSKTEVIQYSMLKLGAETETTIMVGDRKYDAEGAEKNYIDFIGACYGFGTIEELSEYSSVCLAQSTEEIANFLLQGIKHG